MLTLTTKKLVRRLDNTEMEVPKVGMFSVFYGCGLWLSVKPWLPHD